MNRISFILLVFGLCGCSQVSRPSSVDVRANIFFANQRQCERFVHATTWPTIQHLAKMPNISDMRNWINSHPEEAFAKIALNVQVLTKHEGIIYLSNDASQLIITKALYRVLEKQSGFETSGCDVDVQEIIEQEIYLSIGAWNSPIAKYFAQKGIVEASKQRRALLIGLLAGELSPDW